MMSPARFAVPAAMVLLGFLAGFWYRGGQPGTSAAANPSKGRTVLYWHDPMHPAYKSDKPGIAPDCGMQLEPVYVDEDSSLPRTPPGPPGTVVVDASRRQAIGVRLAVAEKRAPTQKIRLPGRVVVDETRIYRLFASSDGWMRDISPYGPGSIVARDELLATYTSRDILTPQRAYIYGLQTRDRNKPDQSTAEQNQAIEMQIRNAEEGLVTLGVSETQIKELARTRTATALMQVRAPECGIILARNVSRGLRIDRSAELYRLADIRRVWVLADVYAGQADQIPRGGRSWVHSNGHVLPGEISESLPLFDANTRTLKVRLEVENPGYRLRPDMFVDVELALALPEAVTVPLDAVIDSGLRKIVYVASGNDQFEPREIETGWRSSDRVAVTRGLKAGERIVAAGNFLIDSESRLRQAAPPPAPPRDPVCGMQADPAGGPRSEYKSKTYFFCSPDCKREFENNPDRFVTLANRH